jgi:hypothetical protein
VQPLHNEDCAVEEDYAMAYTLQELADDIHTALKADPNAAANGTIAKLVARSLTDPEFVAKHLKDRPPGADPREILYEDRELGFCICGHVYEGQSVGKPHDHGSSWAIYGQAVGVTEMTDWQIVEPAAEGKPALVEPARTYVMQPGDAHFYGVGAVHSPSRKAGVKLVRIEGQNLDHVQRSNIKAKEPVAA